MLLRNLFRKSICKGISFKLTKYWYNQYNNNLKFDPKKDYYKILQVDSAASIEQIKKSYYRLAKLYHPDSSSNQGIKFKEISQAYSVLSNQQLRKDYHSQRFLNIFERKMEERFNKQKAQETEDTKPPVFTKQQLEAYAKFNKFLKRFLTFVIFMAIFYPFFQFGYSGNGQTQVVQEQAMEPRRHRGMYLDRNYIKNRAYENEVQQNQGQNYVIVGEVVQD